MKMKHQVINPKKPFRYIPDIQPASELIAWLLSRASVAQHKAVALLCARAAGRSKRLTLDRRIIALLTT